MKLEVILATVRKTNLEIVLGIALGQKMLVSYSVAGCPMPTIQCYIYTIVMCRFTVAWFVAGSVSVLFSEK